ncbi:putative alpha-amylase [Mrakia frigida]|uniref:putative alpha-amylase n=1 Tax=Mrakia frigida TaxID=29902 RepID=UPI003FCC18EF
METPRRIRTRPQYRNHSTSPFSILLLSLLVLLGSCVGEVKGMTSNEWRRRSIYHVVTDRFATTNGSVPRCVTSEQVFCGGSWGGIIKQLPYIQGMGFDAIWISPISANILNSTGAGQAYHGYWPSDLFALQDTPANFQSLITALHSAGMALMVDIVVNDVAWNLPLNTSVWDPTLGRSSPTATNGVYGVLNQPGDYHPRCVMDYSNVTSVQNCWLSDPGTVVLADINTTSTRVRTLLYNLVTSLVTKYGIDGFRIDAAKHVEFSFWKGYAAAAGVFTMGEVLDGDPQAVKLYQTDALSSVLNFPMYYPLWSAFTSTTGSIVALSNMIGTISYWFPDSTVLGGFISSHDNPRPRSATTDSSLLANLYTYSFVADGMPVWYYGDEQGAAGAADPANREALWTLGTKAYDTTAAMYLYVAKLNAIRKAAGLFSLRFYTTKNLVVSYTTNDIVLSKYPLIAVLTNRGSKQSSGSTITFATSYTAGTVVVNALTCTKSTVNSAGQLSVLIATGLPQVSEVFRGRRRKERSNLTVLSVGFWCL